MEVGNIHLGIGDDCSSSCHFFTFHVQGPDVRPVETSSSDLDDVAALAQVVHFALLVSGLFLHWAAEMGLPLARTSVRTADERQYEVRRCYARTDG